MKIYLLEISKKTFEEMMKLGCISIKKNKNEITRYNQTKRKRQIEDDVYTDYLQRIKKYVIVSKSVFKELVTLNYIDLKNTKGKCFKTRDYIFVNKDIYNEYVKYLG